MNEQESKEYAEAKEKQYRELYGMGAKYRKYRKNVRKMKWHVFCTAKKAQP